MSQGELWGHEWISCPHCITETNKVVSTGQVIRERIDREAKAWSANENPQRKRETKSCGQSNGPPIELSASEQMIGKRIRRAKLLIFLREHRNEVFDAALQEELAALYPDSPRGQPPVAPALLAMATILQAYTGASDDEVIEASVMDRSFQLVLDSLDTEEAP